jgi:methionyl-tRNA synthetase
VSEKYFYITTPIYYVNDRPHLGHAYTSIAADVLARFKRLDGYQVKFLTGTDEHGLKVKQAAEKANLTPQQLTDQNSKYFRDLCQLLNFSNDDFIRTTEPRHYKSVQALWQKLIEKDEIYLDKYSGWYAVRDEAYYTEDELIPAADGTKIAPTGAPVEWMEEESYFFRLSKWQDRLLEFYEQNPQFVLPETRFNEVKSFVRSGLKDLSVSRTNFDWGVPVPNDSKHVMYVWIDALTNYITALGYPAESAEFQNYWSQSVHMMAKDILRFHAVYWPAFLMAADLPTPSRVFAHGWWTIEGQKMSKSIGNVISPIDLVQKYGVDATRFFVLREVPFGNDGDFSAQNALNRINNDLANSLGNLVQRTLSFVGKNCDHKIPALENLTAEDQTLLLSSGEVLLQKLRAQLDIQRFDKALELIWGVVSNANIYIDQQAPWALKKTNPERMKCVLSVLCEVIKRVGIFVQPFIPETASKIFRQLNWHCDLAQIPFEKWIENLPANHPILEAVGIFPRVVVDELPTTPNGTSMPKPVAKTPENPIEFSDFQKIDIRVGTILEVHDFPEAKKPAYKLTIDFGPDIGIKYSSAQITVNYKKEDLVGMQIQAVVNFMPKKVGKFSSEVLVLGFEDEAGHIVLSTPHMSCPNGRKLH